MHIHIIFNCQKKVPSLFFYSRGWLQWSSFFLFTVTCVLFCSFTLGQTSHTFSIWSSAWSKPLVFSFLLLKIFALFTLIGFESSISWRRRTSTRARLIPQANFDIALEKILLDRKRLQIFVDKLKHCVADYGATVLPTRLVDQLGRGEGIGAVVGDEIVG